MRGGIFLELEFGMGVQGLVKGVSGEGRATACRMARGLYKNKDADFALLCCGPCLSLQTFNKFDCTQIGGLQFGGSQIGGSP